MDIRPLAFLLPQYHPISENDDWWGPVLTEWRHVTQVKPLFPNHYQPHFPADLVSYDLRIPEVRQQQADLAGQYGLGGFCYKHYWFTGKQLLERPVAEILSSGKPDFPFCLCWANENWTRRWDGQEQEMLIAQHYSPADDLAHIQALLPYFHDPRYIRIQNKPLFLVYRSSALPDPRSTTSPSASRPKPAASKISIW
jgi:lipopolysaccharide biosynthesis protein